MKKLKRYALLVTLCAIFSHAHAQQAQLVSALIDGCAIGNDGADEWVLVYSGGSAITGSDIQVLYGTSSPATTDFTDAYRAIDATSNTFVSNLNTALGTCNFSFVNSESSTNIPAGSHVIIFNDDVLTSGTSVDYDAWCSAFQSGSSIYVLFSTDASWDSSGLFANAPPADRFFRSTVNGNTVDFNYGDNWASTAGGNYVTWNDGGGGASSNSNYTGCQPTDTNGLPIVLLDFSATAMKDHVSVRWTTAQETGNSHFTIERSQNAMNWETVAMVTGSDTSTDEKKYEYKDFSPFPGLSYYRLSQTDFNGNSEVFEVDMVNFNPMGIDLKIFPNPSSDFIMINCSEVVNAISLISSQGRKYMVSQQNNSTMNSRFDIRHIPKGVYRVLIHGTETVFREKLIKK